MIDLLVFATGMVVGLIALMIKAELHRRGVTNRLVTKVLIPVGVVGAGLLVGALANLIR